MNDKQSSLTINKLNLLLDKINSSESALQEIKTNTASISIDADSVNLNTDTLETKLDTVNANLNENTAEIVNLIAETHLITLDTEDIKTKLDTLILGTLWQRETLNGNGFSMVSGFTSIAGTSEVDFILIRNPVASGKLVRLKDFRLTIGATNTQKSIFRFYRSPTITTNGTPLTINKILATQANASVCSAYQQPTISNRGILIAPISVDFNTYTTELDLSRFITQGSDLLITVQAGTTGIEHNVTGNWLEV